jgi:hypothetical protein
LVDNLGNIVFGHFHVPEPFRPNHHIWTERAHIQATASDNANLSLKVSFLN